MSYFDSDYAPDALEVKVSELLIATPDHCDPLLDPAIHRVLKMLRERESMDAAFVCEILDGQRVSRRFHTAQRAQFIDEQQEPLELAFCKQVLRAWVPTGCYLSAPVVLSDGMTYGTLYSFSFSPDPAVEARDIRKLEMASQLAARLIEERRPRAASPAGSTSASASAPMLSAAPARPAAMPQYA
jgi:hypothetical protein